MKTRVCFNLFKQIKKHFLFFVFSFLFFIYLSFVFISKDFFVNANSIIALNVIVLSHVIYFTVLGIYFTNRLFKFFRKEKQWFIIAIKYAFYLLLAFLLYRFLVIFDFVFNHFSDTFSYLWDSILNRLRPETGAKRQLFNPVFFEIVFLIFSLQVFVSFIWKFKVEIKPVFIYFTETETYYFEEYFETNISLGYLYKALP